MGATRDKMQADLELRAFAATTKKEYLRRAHNFVAYHKRPPTELGEQRFLEDEVSGEPTEAVDSDAAGTLVAHSGKNFWTSHL